MCYAVFAARDLQSKRKGGKYINTQSHCSMPVLPTYPPTPTETCQASVVFGLGKSQYVTETVESNSPEWNQEAVM